MEPPTPQQVQRARVELLAARETIDASNDVLAAVNINRNTASRPAKHGDKHCVVKTASIMARQSAKMVLVLRGEISITQNHGSTNNV